MEGLLEWIKGYSHLWSFELFRLDGQPMTIGKLVMGVFLLGVGYWAARRAADAIDRRFLSRLDLEASLRYALRRILFYFFLVVVTLFTLRILNVPITIFTVLGGAVAIGVGFGSQNVVNNFISGTILMVERPIRVGDYVDVDGLRGTIEVIGIRATQLVTPENRQVVIPNSFFLEKPVINWTLSDNVVRGRVVLGVAYGSDPETVRQILEKTCANQSDILREPAPRIIFSDFGDNALVFEIFFWYRLGQGKMTAEIESDLRFAVYREMRRAGIGIPYPQRDVHLDWRGPIQVELSRRGD